MEKVLVAFVVGLCAILLAFMGGNLVAKYRNALIGLDPASSVSIQEQTSNQKE